MKTVTISNLTTPAGTTGLAVEPWSVGEIYAVAANWANAASPVYTYGRNGWQQCGRQVADFRHRPKDALAAEITEALAVSEGIPSDEVDEDEVDGIVEDAVSVESDE